jgi:hypothetical protein
VLGWRPRSGDAKGFVAALDQSFALSEVEGHVEWKWTPKSYAVQADMGAITGAQASIYSRAKAALDQALPILDGLYPLNPDFDPQDIESIRAIVRTEMIELVGELGVSGGPRVQRVDALLDQLVGFAYKRDQTLPALKPHRVGAHLGMVRDRFGLKQELVNTIPEEQNLTNFIILVNYVDTLRLSWQDTRHFFNRLGSDVFLGTQLVLLSRSLAVIAESVQETYYVMDSVFLGSAERETVQLELAPGSIMTIAELLRWAEHFASIEGPRYIEDGGKDGVSSAFVPTLRRLELFVGRAAEIAGSNSGDVVAALRTPRVRRALTELHSEIETALESAESVRRLPGPTIHFALPVTGLSVDADVMSIRGRDFQSNVRVLLRIEKGADDDRVGNKLIEGTALSATESEILAQFDQLELGKVGVRRLLKFSNSAKSAQSGVRVILVVVNGDGGRAEKELVTQPTSGSGQPPAPDNPPSGPDSGGAVDEPIVIDESGNP